MALKRLWRAAVASGFRNVELSLLSLHSYSRTRDGHYVCHWLARHDHDTAVTTSLRLSGSMVTYGASTGCQMCFDFVEIQRRDIPVDVRVLLYYAPNMFNCSRVIFGAVIRPTRMLVAFHQLDLIIIAGFDILRTS